MHKKLYVLAVVLMMALFSLVMANPASATTTTYNLVKTSSFPGDPAVGWHVCQNKYVTLPTLSSSNRYAWAEDYPDGSGDGLTNYRQTFHGKFYWTVCVASMAGTGTNYWTFQEYSIMTLVTSACENEGHCTTYYLQHHYIRDTSGGSRLWGSQLFVRPASWCTFEACEDVASVTVEKT